MKTNIVVRFDLEGLHSWPDAPEEYIYLASSHKHFFHFEIHIPVDNSRQLEFIDVRARLLYEVESLFGGDFGTNSCEMLAIVVAEVVYRIYEILPYRVAVYEDQFVGAEVLE